MNLYLCTEQAGTERPDKRVPDKEVFAVTVFKVQLWYIYVNTFKVSCKQYVWTI